MLREYIISEAMHHLGIPTTRCLAVVDTGETIVREKYCTGAILTRVAQSHLRVGTFEFASHNLNKKDLENLIDYTINRHYSEISESDNKPIALIEAIIENQTSLIVNWMRVGFIHGVMNTDNMALSGETIDYGPCAFLDAYDPNTVFSSIDHMGRYAYINQPIIAQWNVAKFAETLLPIMNGNNQKNTELLKCLIDKMADSYKKKWLTMMGSKIGLFDIREGDEKLITTLLSWMHKNNADYTNTFIALGQNTKPTLKPYNQKDFEAWYMKWKIRLKNNSQPIHAALCMMKENNPVVIPRNHKVNDALNEADNENLKPFTDLLSILESPYENNESLKTYQDPPKANERVYQTFCGT